MYKNTKRPFALAGALLISVAIWGALLTGSAQGQGDQPHMPGAGQHQGMMGSMMEGTHGVQAGVPVTDTAVHGAWDHGMMGGMINRHIGNMMYGMMGSRMGGMMGGAHPIQASVAVTDTSVHAAWDPGMMYGMMGSHMGGMTDSISVTGTVTYGCPHMR